jgi:hypothetical protein
MIRTIRGAAAYWRLPEPDDERSSASRLAFPLRIQFGMLSSSKAGRVTLPDAIDKHEKRASGRSLPIVSKTVSKTVSKACDNWTLCASIKKFQCEKKFRCESRKSKKIDARVDKRTDASDFSRAYFG